VGRAKYQLASLHHINILYRSAAEAFWHRISGVLCSEAEPRRRKQ